MKNIKRKIIPLSLCVSIILGSQLFAENTSTLLEEVQIAEQGNLLYSEETNSYTVKEMNTATKLNLSIKETPQSVVVITTEQIQDQNLESFADITKMKKVLIIQDPRTSTTGQDFLLWTIALYGNKWQDFWKQLKPSIKVVTQDWGEGFDKLLAGEAPLMVSYASNEAYSYEYYGGTKILTLIPKEGGYQQKEGTALVTKKITKKLAKDFIEFTLSNEFQSTVPLNNWMLPAANVKLPKSFDHYKHSSKYVSVSNNDIDKNMEKWLKEWATIMKE